MGQSQMETGFVYFRKNPLEAGNFQENRRPNRHNMPSTLYTFFETQKGNIQ